MNTSSQPGDMSGKNGNRRVRIAVTMEAESWVIRRLAERFMETAGDDCEVIPVLVNETSPPEVDVVLYTDWLHYLQQPKAWRKRLPGVLMVHHLDRFAFRLRLVTLREDVVITCMSQRWVSFLRAWTFPAGKLRSLRYGVDLDLFNPTDTPQAGHMICIGVVGRLYPDGRKGEDRLLNIARMISPQQFAFQFMGDRWDGVAAGLRSLGFSVAVEHNCKESDQPQVYRRMDCLLVCSRKEGGPIPVLEALACGVPVISTNVGFLPELQKQLPFAVRIFATDMDAVKHLGEAKSLKQEAGRCQSQTRAVLVEYSWPVWTGNLKRILMATAALRKRS